MKLEEAISILENNDYVLTERAFDEKDSERVMDVLKEIRDEYVSKGYVVGLYPSKDFNYTVNLGYDPTIGTEYHSWRTRRDTDQERNLFDKPVPNLSNFNPIVLRITRWPSEEFVKYAEKHFGYKDRSRYINRDPYCFYVDIPIRFEPDTENEVTYKIEDDTITGTAEQLKTDVKKLVAKLLQQAKQKQYKSIITPEWTTKYTPKKKGDKYARKVVDALIKKFGKMLYGRTGEDFFTAFDKCRSINTKALDILVAIDAYDKISEDVDYWRWCPTYAYENDYLSSFLSYLNEEWDGDIRAFCESEEINSIEDLQNWYLEGDEYKTPDEHDFDY